MVKSESHKGDIMVVPHLWSPLSIHLWTWGAGEGVGPVTLLPSYCPKKLHNARKHVLYKRTQMAVKTFTIRTSNERIIIPKSFEN